MSVTKGDKIGFTAPADLGDANVWGALLHTIYEQLDELCYAAREDRNNMILGGGAISWDATAGEMSFTEDILIYNHVTDKIVTIESSASPVTLSTDLEVAYVKINRKPGANQSITSVTVAAAGALPNTQSDADSGILVLGVRTPDDTLLVPWCRREILDGDHWQFGSSHSWYERIASSRKPSYFSSTDTSQVVVSGSVASPSVVFINGKLYSNVADETLDLDTAGRNGLDTGAKAANTPYYIYAIPSVSGRTFDTICSITPPTGSGPTGFTAAWSYIGAFATVSGGATVSPFISSQGLYLSDDEIESESHTGGTSPNQETFNSLPTTAKFAYGILNIDGTTIDSPGRAVSRLAATTGNAVIQKISVSGVDMWSQGFVPILTSQSIYLITDTAGNTVTFLLLGWQENPMEFK